MVELDLSQPRTLHIVGVGGAGMSAIATVLVHMGHSVSGSDLRDSPTLERLRLIGIDAQVGHEVKNIPPTTEAVIISTAIPSTNIEVKTAVTNGWPVVSRAEALRALSLTHRSVAVAGSHGKTTTSSILALMLRGAGLRPTFIIGGDLNEAGTNAAYDGGDWMVVEADESDGTFLRLSPEVAIVTNIEPDHIEHYGTFSGLVDAFKQFLTGVTGPKVVCIDDPIARNLIVGLGECHSYGFHEDAQYRLVNYRGTRQGSKFEIENEGVVLGLVEVPTPGRHNALNATAAIVAAGKMGVPFATAVFSVASFGGVSRRFETRGDLNGVTFIDDYAHLPTEVAITIRTAREGGWGRVVVIFQPHRYSRTEQLWRDFSDAFVDADSVIITDVYSAGETPRPGVSGRLVMRAILDAHPECPVQYLPRRSDVVRFGLRDARSGDVVLTLGAGDLTSVPDQWLSQVATEAN